MALSLACLVGCLTVVHAAPAGDEHCLVQSQLLAAQQRQGAGALDPSSSNPFDIPEVPEELQRAWKQLKEWVAKQNHAKRYLQSAKKDRQAPVGLPIPTDMLPDSLKPYFEGNMTATELMAIMKEALGWFKDDVMVDAMMAMSGSMTKRCLRAAEDMQKQGRSLELGISEARNQTEALAHLGAFLTFEGRLYAESMTGLQSDLTTFGHAMPPGHMKDLMNPVLEMVEGLSPREVFSGLWAAFGVLDLQNVISDENEFCKRLRPYYEEEFLPHMSTLFSSSDSMLTSMEAIESNMGMLNVFAPDAKPRVQKMVDDSKAKMHQIAAALKKPVPGATHLFVEAVNSRFHCNLTYLDFHEAKEAVPDFSAAAPRHSGGVLPALVAVAIAAKQALAA
uniref:Plastid lipid-associated protein/fibrillin conserved domain-containing protein n=1 Tax=Alexandrium andersonii TaxID=327968 RepID=A0A7S2J201_9DINO